MLTSLSRPAAAADALAVSASATEVGQPWAQEPLARGGATYSASTTSWSAISTFRGAETLPEQLGMPQ